MVVKLLMPNSLLLFDPVAVWFQICTFISECDINKVGLLILFTGVRTEQDLYARLIDSVTKQVKHHLFCLLATRNLYLVLLCVLMTSFKLCFTWSSPSHMKDRTRIQKCVVSC